MEIHQRVNSVLAKKLWNVVRVTFYMIRKGLVSKRKLMMDLNLMMKRGKLLGKSLSNLMSHHLHLHHSSSHNYMARVGGIQEYEFSCSNSPNPVFFHVHNKRKHHYFPCINLPQVTEHEEEDVHYRNDDVALVPKTPEYTFNLPTESIASPFSVRLSNYSSEEESSDHEGGNEQVDREAEEFIKRFYEQLRLQSRMQLLQYQ